VHLNLGSILMCNKDCDCRMLSNLHNKKDDSDVATGVDYGVSSFLSWSTSICNPKMDVTRITGLSKFVAPFHRRTP
jgi:hypothetical protein